MTEKLFAIRPFSKAERSDLKDALRIYLSPLSFHQYKLENEDSLALVAQDGRQCAATAWAATEKIQDSIVQTSKAFQEINGLKLGDKVSIRRTGSKPLEATAIELAVDSANDTEAIVGDMRAAFKVQASWLSYRAEILTPGLVFKNIELAGVKASLRISKINSSTRPAVYRHVRTTTVRIEDMSGKDADGTTNPSLEIETEGIFGLDQQLEKLNASLRKIDGSYTVPKFSLGKQMSGVGILLHGPPGVGKTMVLERFLAAPWRRSFSINAPTFSLKELQNAFNEACENQPSMIAIDDLNHLEENPLSNSIAILSHEFLKLANSKVLVLGATRNLRTLDERLLSPQCFDTQLEVTIPDSNSRGQILKALNEAPPRQPHGLYDALVEQTQGFTGGDLDRLTREARSLADFESPGVHSSGVHSSEVHSSYEPANGTDTGGGERVLTPPLSFFETVLKTVRPSSMSTVHLATPEIRWTEIGGVHQTKSALKEAIEWPFRHFDLVKRMGVSPKKGLLLYGPPGCAKTLTAKAVATEAHWNFLAVKGAELLNMYVGESERGVRDVFAKARAASPSVLFFDEIDSIGGARETGPGGSQQLGINVLTTLLNELDGIEVLNGVFVLAATNNPQVLDPALMRPGRLDQLLYVGLPNLQDREEIVRIRFRKLDVADEVDPAWLAEQTGGYSGAELTSICEFAGFAAIRECIESAHVDGKIGHRHFEQAMQKVDRRVTPEMIAAYERWGNQVGAV